MKNMKMKIGFNIGESKKENKENQVSTATPEVTSETPVRSVVTVAFDNGKQYPYYNDEFDLKLGDIVFVDGKLAGKRGRVIEITTKFKVSLDFYKRVIAKLKLEFHGRFKRFGDMMVSENSDLCAEQVITWLIPPREEEEEFYVGDGYELAIGNFSDCPDIHQKDYEDALELCCNDAVKFIIVKNGAGKAIVEDRGFHIVDFTFESGMLKDLYCDCISPNLCKHMLATSLVLQMLLEKKAISDGNDFAAMSYDLFHNVVSYNSQEINI